MSRKYYSQELLTGVVNTDTLGDGITSTEGEPKKLVAVIITASAKQDNQVRLWYEREKIVELPVQQIPLRTYAMQMRIPVDFDLPVGKTLKASINCGGTANNADITYEWELTG